MAVDIGRLDALTHSQLLIEDRVWEAADIRAIIYRSGLWELSCEVKCFTQPVGWLHGCLTLIGPLVHSLPACVKLHVIRLAVMIKPVTMLCATSMLLLTLRAVVAVMPTVYFITSVFFALLYRVYIIIFFCLTSCNLLKKYRYYCTTSPAPLVSKLLIDDDLRAWSDFLYGPPIIANITSKLSHVYQV